MCKNAHYQEWMDLKTWSAPRAVVFLHDVAAVGAKSPRGDQVKRLPKKSVKTESAGDPDAHYRLRNSGRGDRHREANLARNSANPSFVPRFEVVFVGPSFSSSICCSSHQALEPLRSARQTLLLEDCSTAWLPCRIPHEQSCCCRRSDVRICHPLTMDVPDAN